MMGRQCEKCGATLGDDETQCEQCNCQVSADNNTASESIPTYLFSSILATLFCCLPIGIVALVYACQVKSKQSAGDIEGAKQASKKARMWANIAGGIALLAILTLIMLNFILPALIHS